MIKSSATKIIRTDKKHYEKNCLIYAFILACTLQFATAQEYILTSVAKKGATYLNVAEDSLLFDLNYGEMCVAVNLNIDLMTGEASGM